MGEEVPSFLADTVLCSNETDGQTCYWEYSEKGGILFQDYAECSKTPILLPGFNLLPDWFLAIVYGLTLVWSFFGIAIISDLFMSAIEVITSLEREVKRHGSDGNKITVKVLVWNSSVANLTLMALGSSAPEIMIAIIETVVTLGDTPGELGPSTIVGSAAFNLLLISAVCILAVPEGQTKSISEFPVFIWTAFMSLFAYFWMLVVYKFWTPDQVTVVEAVITLLCLPLLVGVAYVLDRKPWKAKSDDIGSDEDELTKPGLYQVVVGAHGTGSTGQEYTVTKEDIDMYLSYHTHLGKEMEEAEIAQIIAEGRFHRAGSDNQDIPACSKPIRSSFRNQGSGITRTGSSIGGSEIDRTSSAAPWYDRTSIDRNAVMAQLEELKTRRERCGLDPDISEEDIQSVVRSVQSKQAKNDMSALQYRINARNALTGRTHLAVAYPSSSQATGAASPDLHRSSAPPTSNLDQVPKLMFASEEYRVLESQKGLRVMVHCTRPAQAKDTTVTVNYTTRDGSARGGDDYAATSGQLRFDPGVTTQVIEIIVFEDDLVEDDEDFFVDLSGPTPESVHISKPTARVTIVDTTESGVVQFSRTHISVQCTKAEVHVPVIRKGGCNGSVTLTYATQTDTAASGIDFEHTSGRLTFESGESMKLITIPLKGNSQAGTFTLSLKALHDHTGVQLSRRRAICSIEIVSDHRSDNMNSLVDRILDRKADSDGSHMSEWLQQFRDAVLPGRVLDEEGEPKALRASTILLHYLSITWKLIFAVVPPPEMYSGVPCFFVSLLMIAGLTYFVAPVASMFGCAVGLSDLMTAVVFVAIGTSLPDTFASHQAAVEADDADAAIGNVTGSNSVNVFLGLGLPWLIAGLYYETNGEKYLTPAGPLSFSVMIFMICATVCLALLVLKRFQGGELGGRGFMRRGVAAILFFLWLFYLIMSGLQDTGKIEWSGR